MRDLVCYPRRHFGLFAQPGLETLPYAWNGTARMQTPSALCKGHEKIESVSYPTLGSDQKALGKTYLPGGCSGVVSFVVGGA